MVMEGSPGLMANITTDSIEMILNVAKGNFMIRIESWFGGNLATKQNKQLKINFFNYKFYVLLKPAP